MILHHGDRFWISKKATVVLFTSKERAEKMDKAYKLKYTEVVGFENFDSTGLVEYQAIQYNKKYNFTHVILLFLFSKME